MRIPSCVCDLQSRRRCAVRTARDGAAGDIFRYPPNRQARLWTTRICTYYSLYTPLIQSNALASPVRYAPADIPQCLQQCCDIVDGGAHVIRAGARNGKKNVSPERFMNRTLRWAPRRLHKHKWDARCEMRAVRWTVSMVLVVRPAIRLNVIQTDPSPNRSTAMHSTNTHFRPSIVGNRCRGGDNHVQAHPNVSIQIYSITSLSVLLQLARIFLAMRAQATWNETSRDWRA